MIRVGDRRSFEALKVRGSSILVKDAVRVAGDMCENFLDAVGFLSFVCLETPK